MAKVIYKGKTYKTLRAAHKDYPEMRYHIFCSMLQKAGAYTMKRRANRGMKLDYELQNKLLRGK